ncbi:MAG: fluoride efflux transporter CrcB [Phycisphaerales bacterium]
MKLLIVFLGGGTGAMLRYSTGLLVARLTPTGAETPHWLTMYPAATLIVNLLGCGLIGLAWGMLGDPEEGNEALRLALIVGMLGGFTTFSSFGWETLDLLYQGRILTAIVYILLSVLVGLFSAWSGHALGMALVGG